MKANANLHHRRSIRLMGYDYSQPGAYFVTVVTIGRECLLGEIAGGKIHLNPMGKLVEQVWFGLPEHYPQVDLGAFCIMPNHVHAVIILNEIVGLERAGHVGAGHVGAGHVEAGLRPAPTVAPTALLGKIHPLSEIVRAFKSFSARQINEYRNTRGEPVWQRNYYEHIIRNEEQHHRIHLYIEANAENWATDEENLDNKK